MNGAPDNPNRLLDILVRQDIVDDAAGWSIQPARGGLNSTVFVATDPAGVKRLTLRWIDRADRFDYERNLLAELSDCDCVPPVHGAVPELNLLVVGYLAGATAPLEQVSDRGMEHLAGCLACIHGHQRETYTIWPSVEPRTGSRAHLFRDRLESLATYPPASRDAWPTVDGRILPLLDHLRRNVPGWSERHFVPLHGDLSPGNIMWDEPRVGLIDWEYARDGDPAEEIAYLLTEQTVPAARVAVFRDAYLAAGDDADIWHRVDAYAPLVSLDSALWWIDYLIRTGDNPHASREVRTRLDLAWSLANR